MKDVLLVGVAVFFAGMAVVALARPGFVVGIFGMQAGTADARNEVRAVYGGFGIAVAAVLFAALGATSTYRGTALLVVSIALLGMAGGRLIAFVVERPARPHPTATFCLVEVVLALALLVAR